MSDNTATYDFSTHWYEQWSLMPGLAIKYAKNFSNTS